MSGIIGVIVGRLIDVDVAIMAAVEYIEDWNHVQSMYHRRKLTEKFMALPTVDAVPVRHGHWIYHPECVADGECGYECSACGMGSDVDYQFCMRCGAKMDWKDGDGNG